MLCSFQECTMCTQVTTDMWPCKLCSHGDLSMILALHCDITTHWKTGTPDQHLSSWPVDLILFWPLKSPLEIWSSAGVISVIMYRRGLDVSKDFAAIINKVQKRKKRYRDQHVDLEYSQRWERERNCVYS